MSRRVLDDADEALLDLIELRVGQHVRHADDGVHRRPDFVTHHGEKVGLRLCRLFGIRPRTAQVDHGCLLAGQERGDPSREAQQQQREQSRAEPNEPGGSVPEFQDQLVGRRDVDHERIVLERAGGHDPHLTRILVGQARARGDDGPAFAAAADDFAEHRLIPE